MPALPNAEVRRLERALADSDSTGQAYYVCPSAKEEFGIAVLEAMDAGLPVAATDRGGIPHYLQDGVNGLLLDTSSPTTLAAGLSRLLAVPSGDLAAMRARAAVTVRSAYSIEAAASAFVTVYLAVAGEQPRDRTVPAEPATVSRAQEPRGVRAAIAAPDVDKAASPGRPNNTYGFVWTFPAGVAWRDVPGRRGF